MMMSSVVHGYDNDDVAKDHVNGTGVIARRRSRRNKGYPNPEKVFPRDDIDADNDGIVDHDDTGDEDEDEDDVKECEECVHSDERTTMSSLSVNKTPNSSTGSLCLEEHQDSSPWRRRRAERRG